jgi:hypothetical protein
VTQVRREGWLPRAAAAQSPMKIRQYKFRDHQDDEGGMRRTGEDIGKAPTNAAGEKHCAQKRHAIQM